MVDFHRSSHNLLHMCIILLQYLCTYVRTYGCCLATYTYICLINADNYFNVFVLVHR